MPANTEHTNTEPPPGGRRLIAVHSFAGDAEGDLPFSQGEEIVGLRLDGQWWTGRNTAGATGSFPANFVKEVAPATSEAASAGGGAASAGADGSGGGSSKDVESGVFDNGSGGFGNAAPTAPTSAEQCYAWYQQCQEDDPEKPRSLGKRLLHEPLLLVTFCGLIACMALAGKCPGVHSASAFAIIQQGCAFSASMIRIICSVYREAKVPLRQKSPAAKANFVLSLMPVIMLPWGAAITFPVVQEASSGELICTPIIFWTTFLGSVIPLAVIGGFVLYALFRLGQSGYHSTANQPILGMGNGISGTLERADALLEHDDLANNNNNM